MKYFNILLSVALGLLGASSSLADFTLIRPGVAISEGASIHETFWRSPVGSGGPFDEIGLHLYQQPLVAPKLNLLYLPGTNMNGELSVMDEDHNLWLYLAARGVNVYTLDYRTHAIPNTKTGDFEFMRQWGIEQFVDDVTVAIDFINSSSPRLPLFVAGFSRGVSYAYAVSGRRELAGLIALDGSFKTHQPQPFDIASALNRLDQSGEYVNILSRSRGWENRQQLMRLAWQDPEGPGLTERYESIGEQLTDTLYRAWGKGGLANPVDGISSITVLARTMENYDRFFPAIQDIQGRSLASQLNDPATLLDDHFGSMQIPILYFGATNLGAENLMNGIYSASRSGSRDVTINVLENHGHLDVLVGNRVRELVFDVTIEWLLSRLPVQAEPAGLEGA